MPQGRTGRDGAPLGASDQATASAAVQRLAAIVASTDDAVFTKDRDGIITSWNAGAQRLYGYAEDEAIGRPVSILVPPSRAGEEREILRRIFGGERIASYDTDRVTRDGRIVHVSLSVSPVHDEEGRIVEASVIARDVTATRRAERTRERLLAVAQGLGQAVTVEQVVAVVLGEGLSALGATAALVALPPRRGRRLELLGAAGYSDEVTRQWGEITLDHRLPVTEALATGRPVWLAAGDAEGRRRWEDSERRLALAPDESVAALPLVARGAVLGVLGARLPATQPLGPEERDFMVVLAQQCAQALDRAQLYEAEREARRQADEERRRAEYLAEAGSVLSTSLDPAKTLERVARLAVPAMADWAFVELLEEDGRLSRPVIVHADPERERWARELAQRYPVDLDAAHGSAMVLRTGHAELTRDVSDELLQRAARDEEHLRLLREVGFASAMIVPLRARGRVLGALTLASAQSGRRFAAADLTMAQALGDRCALAIDNARLFTERSYIARTLQEGLLPARLPGIPDVELGVRYRAAGRELQVGGDFYDVFAVGRGWTFVVGDVVGKGAAAAAITGLARHTLRAASLYEQRPGAVLQVLNRAMREQLADDEQFCTVCCVHLSTETRELRVASGGHALPFVLGADGTVRPVGRPGTLIGVFDEARLPEEVVRLAPGDTVVLYTDGVTDARGAAGRFGEEQLRALLALSVGMPPAQLADHIERAASAYHDGPPADDIAVVAFALR